MSNDVHLEADFTLNTQPDIQADFYINMFKWGDIQGDIQDQTDLIDLIDTKIDIEATARENNDLLLQNGINTLNDDLTAEISNRGTADGILQDNIDTLSDTVTNNYNALDSAITSEATTRANADTTLQSNIDTLSSTVTSNYNTLNGAITSEQTERENADNTLQDNIDTLSGTVTSNYNTLDGKIGDNKTAIDNHIADKSNPHEVTKSQVGLGNVDNTSDLNKPISTATQTALDGKANTSDLSTVATTGDYDDLSNKPTIPTVNDATLTIQKNGTDVATFTANSSTNQTANITVPTQASDIGALPDTTTINDLTTAEQQSALNSGANTTNIGQIATNTQNISNEVTNRQNADNALQSQIDALVVASDVFDIVGTYAELQAYDISTVPVNDIIKVLVDSTHNNAATYYRCVENDNVKSWSYIGAEGAYYTKSEADGRFVEQTTTVNGQALSNNITLTASDVGALPDSTTIGNGTLTIQKNGSTIDSFGANDTGNTTVNISVPTDTGDLTNNAGYTKNVGTVTSVNNTQPDTNGNVTLSIPAAQVQSNWNETDTSSKAYIQNKPSLSTVATTGDYDDLTNKPTLFSGNYNDLSNKPSLSTVATTGDYDDLTNKPTIPAAQVNSDWNASSGVAQILNKPTLSTVATTGDYDDLSNKPTIPAVGNGTITITQGGTTKGTFTTNQSGDSTIDLDAGGGSSTDVQINGTSITSGGVADIITEGIYDASSNKIVTMSELASKQDVLETGNGITISELDDTRSIAKVNNTTGEWHGVAYGNGIYVAVDYLGSVMTSTDGINWTNQGQKLYSVTVGDNSITFGNGLFVVCATHFNNYTIIYTSSDGITWSSKSISSANDPRGITYGGGKFVVASRQHILTSSDGENWTVISVSSSSTNWMNVAYGNGLFVAVGTNNYIMTSTDGATWSTPKKISGSSIGYTITYGDGKFIIGEQYVTTSIDGETWTTPVSVGSSMFFKSIIWVENKFVAVGYRTGTYVGIITTSTDGTTWTTPVIKGTVAWRSVVAKGYDCVAIANDYSTKFTMKPVTAIYILPDSSLSSTSENAVQNKVINTALNGKVDTSRTVNGKALTSNITLATSDISNCESTTNKVTSISSSSTDTQYPTAKCMYDIVGDVETLINAL